MRTAMSLYLSSNLLLLVLLLLQLQELAKDVFEAADTDKSGKIGPEEFYEWARVHNSTKSLMDRFQRVSYCLHAA